MLPAATFRTVVPLAVSASLKMPPGQMLRLDTPPENWRERPYRADVRRAGDRWALEHQSLALRVPSALCPGEYNVLVNLLHPDFGRLQRGEAVGLEVDSRLRRGSGSRRRRAAVAAEGV